MAQPCSQHALALAVCLPFQSMATPDHRPLTVVYQVELNVALVEKSGAAPRPLGSFRYSLETLLFDDKRDLPLAPRPLLDANMSVVGEITVAIKALKALELIDAAIDEVGTAAAAPADPAPSDPAADSLTVGLTAFRATGKAVASIVQVQVEVDLPGEDEPLRCAPAALKKGQAVLTFKRSYSMVTGTELRAAVMEALRSKDNKEDSDILFAVLGIDKAGKASTGASRKASALSMPNTMRTHTHALAPYRRRPNLAWRLIRSKSSSRRRCAPWIQFSEMRAVYSPGARTDLQTAVLPASHVTAHLTVPSSHAYCAQADQPQLNLEVRAAAIGSKEGAKVGELTCSIRALAAMRRIEAEADSTSLGIEVGALRLKRPPKAPNGSGASQLVVHVDVLGAHSARSAVADAASATTQDGAPVRLKKDFDVRPGSKLADALANALGSDDPKAADLMFSVRHLTSKTSGRGRCSLLNAPRMPAHVAWQPADGWPSTPCPST